VVYFAADSRDIYFKTQYADILLARTRIWWKPIKLSITTHYLLDESPLGATERPGTNRIMFEGLSLEGQISQFAKITTNLCRATPDMSEMRQKN